MKNKITLHDTIINTILSLKPLFVEFDHDSLRDNWLEDEPVIDLDKNEIYINTDYTKGFIHGKQIGFNAWCYLDVELLVKILNLKGDCIDAYGSILIKDELLLNNYNMKLECDFANFDKKSYCDILSFCTVNKKGVARFTQIVYSFKFNRLMVRDDVKYQIPFKVNLKKDLGGKRATYRYGSILSLRMKMSEYSKKIPLENRLSKEYENDLSYPRLILNQK